MRGDVQRELIGRLRSEQALPLEDPYELDTARYRDPAWLERERTQVFRKFPLIVAHEAQLANEGDFVTRVIAGVPLLIVRDGEGTIRVTRNVCRHRGARLVQEASGCNKRTLVCRYHAWCWNLEGELIHVPQHEQFPNLDTGKRQLIPIASEVRHGFVWVRLDGEEPVDVESFLGPDLDADLESFFATPHTIYKHTQLERNANWKLVIDAFAEGYHARSLHKKSVARFFTDRIILDDLSPHTRQAGARKSLDKVDDSADLRTHATLFYTVFPNAVFVVHPDFISQLSVWPRGVDGLEFEHRMLTPPGDKDWGPSYELIDQTVFQKEDLSIVESVQSNMHMVDHVLLGGLERGVYLFHQALDAALGAE